MLRWSTYDNFPSSQRSKKATFSTDIDIYEDFFASSNSAQLRDRLESVESDPAAIVKKLSLRDEVRQILRILSPQEAKVIEMRFGLLDNVSMNLAEIGRCLGLSRERIRQVESNALDKLRKVHTDPEELRFIVEIVNPSMEAKNATVESDMRVSS